LQHANPARNLQPIHSGHHPVQNRQLWRSWLLQRLPGLQPVGGDRHLMTLAPQRGRQHGPRCEVAICDQNSHSRPNFRARSKLATPKKSRKWSGSLRYFGRSAPLARLHSVARLLIKFVSSARFVVPILGHCLFQLHKLVIQFDDPNRNRAQVARECHLLDLIGNRTQGFPTNVSRRAPQKPGHPASTRQVPVIDTPAKLLDLVRNVLQEGRREGASKRLRRRLTRAYGARPEERAALFFGILNGLIPAIRSFAARWPSSGSHVSESAAGMN